MSDFTAIVVGAGPAGLVAAVLLAQEGVKVALVAPSQKPDPRTTALMQPALQLLRHIKLWPASLEAQCAPLKQLHIIDDTGNLVKAPDLKFTASEIDLQAFGWNVPLAALVPALITRAQAVGVTIVEQEVTAVYPSSEKVDVTLGDGTAFSARVVLAADGFHSVVRKALGIDFRVRSFEQEALATSFAHSLPHHGISTEWHTPSGPFTTVPLPGSRSSLVWMERPARMSALAALNDLQLATEIQLQTHGRLGRISEPGPRAIFAMRSGSSSSFAARRCLLIGEAGHILPPIGAQGLNLSLRDAAHAADLILGADDPGSDAVMSAYNGLLIPDILPRQGIVSLVNQSLLAEAWPLNIMRAASLALVNSVSPLRRAVINAGLKPPGDLPFSMT